MSKWPKGVFYDCSNTLGIGSYNNYKDTFSTIEDRIEYKEVGNLKTPEFYITYNKLDYKIKDLIASFYEKLEFLIGEEAPDGINFNFSTQVRTSPEYIRRKQVARKLVVQINCAEKEDNYLQSDYVKKLHTIWPRVEDYLNHV